LGAVVVHGAYANVGFLIYLATHGVLQAFAGLNETGDRRVTILRPARLSSEQASFPIVNEDDHRRIGTRKYLSRTIRICASTRVAARVGQSR